MGMSETLEVIINLVMLSNMLPETNVYITSKVKSRENLLAGASYYILNFLVIIPKITVFR